MSSCPGKPSFAKATYDPTNRRRQIPRDEEKTYDLGRVVGVVDAGQVAVRLLKLHETPEQEMELLGAAYVNMCKYHSRNTRKKQENREKA